MELAWAPALQHTVKGTLRCVRGTREECGARVLHVVIASAAKQSRTPPRKDSGLLRRFAPRNDGTRGGIVGLHRAFQLADMLSHSRGSSRPSFASSLHPLEPRGRR